ncbi:hypothetical protein PM082_001156 [Marasmius tenuissimus]|nr:hypothetical protein PM082_001156 [Marasmius tenuissimus]
MQASELLHVDLSDLRSLYPRDPGNQVNELRNHLVACRWLSNQAKLAPGTSGISAIEISSLATLLVKDTDSEQLVRDSNASVDGDCRSKVSTIAARSDEWKVSTSIKRFAPIEFLNIHPFTDPDVNGPVSRLLLLDHMLHQGYLPIVIVDLEREEYVQAVSRARKGNPESFVLAAIVTQLDELWAFIIDQYMGH